MEAIVVQERTPRYHAVSSSKVGGGGGGNVGLVVLYNIVYIQFCTYVRERRYSLLSLACVHDN